ncbi:MAG TPA: papain-like cysteine protease family protein, partial [Kofleriaceae bacterium]
QAARVVRVGEPLHAATLLEADRATRFSLARDLLRAAPAVAARPLMDGAHTADWDETPTLYQATSIAHGHVLTMRQTWHADGYSLGDLLYSLPLAPGQKKQIATVDWDRSESVLRLSERDERETLAAQIQRDRDISDIVRGALDEHVRAGSSATTGAVGGGIGLAIGPIVIGAGGGSAWSASSAWQTASRDVAGRSLQQVRDRTVQSASAARSQRTTVVQAVRQGESVRAEATTVANYNHCHAMTVQYFEVLRHFQLTHEVVGVAECLFVPFLVSEFDLEKALRWREPLTAALRRRDLAGAFDAAERVRSNWVDAHVPAGAYAEDPLQWLDAELYVRIELPRPKDTDKAEFDAASWAPYAHLLSRTPQEEWKLWLGVVTEAERDRVWAMRIAPRVARKLVDQLTLAMIEPGGTRHAIPIDATLVSTWRSGASQLVTLRPRGALPSLRRSDIATVVLASGVAVPVVATVIVERGSMRYRTAFLHHELFADRLIEDDLGTADDVEIAVRLDAAEKRRPRDEDRRAVAALLAHLNAHLEYYHRNIWLQMHPNRRYLLLDGFEAPNAGGRSVASVIENRVIGVVGNSLVFPLAPGVHLDPATTIPPTADGDLLAYYNADPPPPVRVSVPTRGVFAEAILGSCNSCEIKDDTRFWRWEEAPIPDKPAELAAVSTASRRSATAALRPDSFSTPLVGLQALSELPAPAAFKAALDLIGTPNLFRDLTGVDLNIQNAGQALSSALGTAQFFGDQAAKLAQQQFLSKNTDRVLAAIADARKKKLISDEQAQDLTARALGGSVGSSANDPRPTQSPAVQKAIRRASSSDNGRVTVTRPSGSVDVRSGNDPSETSFDFTVDPPVVLVKQTGSLLCWAAAGAMLMNWRDQLSRSLADAASEAGAEWRAKVDGNAGLGAPELRAYAKAIGLVEEGPADYTPRGLLGMLQGFGPLWVIHDDFVADNQLVHARIVTGIRGDGQPDSTTVRILDPATTGALEESFTTFAARLDGRDPVSFGVGILHFPA